jgi:hypothetical protein
LRDPIIKKKTTFRTVSLSNFFFHPQKNVCFLDVDTFKIISLQNFQKQFIKTLQDEEENEDPLAMEEDDSVLEGSVTESSLIEAPDSGETGEVKEEVKIIQVLMLFLFCFVLLFCV